MRKFSSGTNVVSCINAENCTKYVLREKWYFIGRAFAREPAENEVNRFGERGAPAKRGRRERCRTDKDAQKREAYVTQQPPSRAGFSAQD